MSLLDQETLLPGVSTEIITNFGSDYDTTQFGTTDSVVIVGTAFDGPVRQAVPVYSPEHAKYVFGKVYDSRTRREATLVSNIQDAWDRGCRTIWAVRISGKEINKDYQFAVDTNLKLRVSGRFPSNANKDLVMVYDDSDNSSVIKIYKSGARATIQEKKQGLVESNSAILVNTINLSDSGITKNDELVELIERVNSYNMNNVIKLSIVDEKGNDVTYSSKDAKGIRVGDMFPGIYTIGRAANMPGIKADTKIELMVDKKPYEYFEGDLFKKLVLNTNVSTDLPIYSEKGNINEILGITSINEYDFLEMPEKIDTIFAKDKVDYEEVDLSSFDIYKKLGSGYAVNAYVMEETVTNQGVQKTRYKVKEVTDKSARVSPINDGLYSMLENVNGRYRVLAGVYADTKIKGRLPKLEEFKMAASQKAKMLDEVVTVKSFVNEKDFTEPKKYNISIKAMDEEFEAKLDDAKAMTFLGKNARQATFLTFEDLAANKKKAYKEGSLFLVSGCTSPDMDGPQNLLYVFTNGAFVCLHDFVAKKQDDLLKDSLILAGNKLYKCSKEVVHQTNNLVSMTTFQDATMEDLKEDQVQKHNVIVSLDNGTFVLAHVEAGTTSDSNDVVKAGEAVTGSVVAGQKASAARTAGALTVTILGTVAQAFSEEDDKTLTILSSDYSAAGNDIVIISNEFDYLTIDELMTKLDEDKDLKKILTFEVNNITAAQDYVLDAINNQASSSLAVTIMDKAIAYDTNKYIPFRTDDNFARQLAQHCYYTSMKTAPTHGIIGTSVLLDTSIDSVAKRVDELSRMNLGQTFLAKKLNGTNMLNKDNVPYNIGQSVSVVVNQYPVTTDTNYTFISNMAAGYAGMISTLPLDQSSTCQPIDIPDGMYELTNYQLQTLTNAGFVTIKRSYSKGLVVTDGITMAPSASPFRRLSASRIISAVEGLIRKDCEPFIGKQNNLTNQNSLTASIKSDLDKIKGKLIEGYEFKLNIDRKLQQLGRIDVNYRVVPIYEIKDIRNTIKVEE